VEDLARGLHAALPEPEALASAIVLTPTRRGARSLADAFVKTAGGGAVLLPQLRPLGDLDEGEPPFEPGALALELPAAIDPMRRRFELARLVAGHEIGEGEGLDPAAALALADALGGFLDSLEIEERVDPDAIAALVEGDLARHWAQSVDFLKIAVEAWPKRLRELGLADPMARRVRLLRLLAEQWEHAPPHLPLIAAGSTGTAPATADVLGVVARAPKGCVVLPGLDLDLADAAWAQVDEQHPQGAMKRLLQRHGITRGQVAIWPASGDAPADPKGRARRRLINEALRPAEATADWLAQIGKLREEARGDEDIVAEGLMGLSVVTARAEEEAATVAALLMRETLEDPERTCALVTPDQDLARRVSARLSRWDVEADISAGALLSATPVGLLATLVVRLGADPLDPIAMLAVLKHPLVRLARTPFDLMRATASLERRGLRGPRAPSFEALAERLQAHQAALALVSELWTAVEFLTAAFAGGTASVAAAARALAQAMERLARDESDRVGLLWGGAEGEAAAGLIAGLIEHGAALPPATPSAFAELVELLAGEASVRTGGASHPRLRILGAIEARLVRADRLVLAGLEEGVWPRAAPLDPFLSRPMRQQLGLPPPERRIGLAAHDFAQAASAPEVFMIACERRGGQPAQPSRWLWRLETLAKGAGVAIDRRPDLIELARAIDAPLSPAPPELQPARRPRPTPPRDARPLEMPVTRVEAWVRDPYAVYARSILRLRPLDPPGAPIDARGRGTAVHKAFQRLVEEHPELPADTAAAFEDLLLAELVRTGMTGAQLAREAVLARNLGRWVEEFERQRRADARLIVEQQGFIEFETVAGRTFRLTAKPDRLELRDGAADILDFKTGAPPTMSQVKTGFAPQLTLTAAIVAGGGFEGAGALPSGQLLYVRVTGRRTPASEEPRGERGESPALAADALEGLKRLVDKFEDETTPYVSWLAPQFLSDRGGDYDHLARLWEWAVIGTDEAEEIA
jgi:ATP-dependent helicase/nuclease subunit B